MIDKITQEGKNVIHMQQLKYINIFTWAHPLKNYENHMIFYGYGLS